MRPDRHGPAPSGIAGQKGFALIDALIAVFVVSLGLTSAIDMIGHMQYEMDMYRKYMLVGMLGQSKLEEIDAKATLPVDSSGNFSSEMGISTYTGFTYTVKVTPITSAGLKAPAYDLTGKSAKVEVTVTFNDLKGKSHSHAITAIKTIRGG